MPFCTSDARGFFQRALRRHRLQLVRPDLPAQDVVDPQPFDQRHASLIAGLQTRPAACPAAFAAKLAQQTLVQNQFHGGGDGRVVRAHNEQPLQHAFAGTGVQGRNDQMPGQRGPHGDVGGFLVANFADDEGLRVLPQQMPRGPGKIQPPRLVHFRLHDAGDDLFHRVFDGDDVASARFGQAAQAGVNRCGLPAARRAGEQQHSRRLAQKILQFRRRFVGKFQFGDAFGRERD